jgi:NAD(P)H-hydrate epimerase
MTLALPKTGLNNHEATPFIGDLYLADISVPRELYQQMGIDLPPIFNKESIVKI